MEYPSLSHHGGTRGVTGSCHQLHLDPSSLLVDCGLEQGADAAPGAESAPLGFDVQGIQALVITHVHLDHVGRIPALLAAGYRGPILCSEPSARLLPLVLEDAYKLSISSEPAHVARYLDFIRGLIVPLPFEQWHSLVERPVSPAAFACSAPAIYWVRPMSNATCSMSKPMHPLRLLRRPGRLWPPCCPLQPSERADVLVLESTYEDACTPCRRPSAAPGRRYRSRPGR